MVRSIYEVLGSAEIPNYCAGNRKSDGTKNFGSLKVKVSVVPSDETHSQPAESACIPVRVNREVSERRMPEKRRSLNFVDSNRVRLDHSGESFGPGHYSPAEQQQAYKRRRQKLPIPERQIFEDSIRAYQEIPFRHRHFPSQPKTVGQRCGSCSNYRDYVNLSELENCCSHYPNSHHPGIHHVRHCDRHCSCAIPSSPPSKYPEMSGNCRHTDNATSPMQCCVRSNLRPSTSLQTNVYQNLSNPNRARNLAYYNQQQTERKNRERKEEESHHAKKHRERQKERMRAMQQVKEWIHNEFVGGPDVCVLKGREDAAAEPGDITVHHRHVHEHHHFLHHKD